MKTFTTNDINVYNKLANMDIMPITFRDGSWIYEKNGKLILALNTL